MKVKIKKTMKMKFELLMVALHYASWLARANADDIENEDEDEVRRRQDENSREFED